MKRLLAIAVFCWTLAIASWAAAQSVELSVQSREIFADVPFVLQITLNEFEESPEPKISDFDIDGASVQFLGMSPSVMSRRSIVNGVVTSSRTVRLVFSYRVEAHKPGRYEIPPISATQGGVVATSPASAFEARGVSDSQDMRIAMKVPERPVWIGESFEVGIEWLLRRNPRDQTFVIPLFDHPAFEVQAPESASREKLGFQARGREVELPYISEKVREGGAEYTRFAFSSVLTPTKAGRYELEAPRVVAKLQTGTGRDAFNFRTPRYELFKAAGKKQSFEVKPLPLTGRPASFSNAVGAGFSISVATSRSVVSVGEPIELTIVLGGARGLEGLSLPSLLGEGRLDKNLFDVVGDAATGEMSEDGKSRTFNVSVVLNSAEAREIPAIEFSYFDPEDASYKTVKSQPIALNVDGAAMVGASDVVSSKKQSGSSGAAKGGARGQAFAGDLTPSTGARTLRTVTSLATIRPLLYALYIVPLLLFGIALWLRRTGAARGRSGKLKARLNRVREAASAAKKQPAADSAGELINSMRDLAKATGNKAGAWRSEVESLAFDPKRRQEPIAGALVEDALKEAQSWLDEALRSGKTSSTGGKVGTAIVIFLSAAAMPSWASADTKSKLADASASYAKALATPDRGDRTRNFEATERLYRDLVQGMPHHPELLSDWGNAALGAGDLGTAALAYRRALNIDQSLERAQKNLDWVRQQMPEHLVPKTDAGAVDSLFFWHRNWSLATRHLVAAAAFAIFVLLVTPWGFRYQSALRRASVLPLLLFVATIGSALLERGDTNAAVIVHDGKTLYSADSLGAPVAMSAPTRGGLEVTLRERRGTWTKVVLADGTAGWLKSDSVVAIATP
jgi:tetratricopeptide (TPR) repeat protein